MSMTIAGLSLGMWELIAVVTIGVVGNAIVYGPGLLQKIKAARPAARAQPKTVVVRPTIAIGAPAGAVDWVNLIVRAAGEKAPPQFVLQHLMAGSDEKTVMVERIRFLEGKTDKPKEPTA